MSFFRTSGPVIIFLLFGCSSSSQLSQTVPHNENPDPAEHENSEGGSVVTPAQALVWPDDGSVYWIEHHDGEASEIASRHEPVWISNGGVWTLRREEVTINLVNCFALRPGASEDPDPPPTPDPVLSERIFMEEVVSGQRVTISAAYEDSGFLGDFEEEVSLNTVGPFVFVARYSVEYGCGAAHHLSGTDFVYWNAHEQAQIEERIWRNGVPDFLREQAGQEINLAEDCGGPDVYPDLEAMEVSLGPGGPVASYWYSVGTSYMCSDQTLNGNSVSTQVESPDIPEFLVPPPSPPEFVRSYASEISPDWYWWVAIPEGDDIQRGLNQAFGLGMPEDLELPPQLAPDDVDFVDERDGRGWGDRCFHHLRAEAYEFAEAACLRGLEIASDDTVRGALLYNLGRIREAEGTFNEAREFYQRSLDVRPGNQIVVERLESISE